MGNQYIETIGMYADKVFKEFPSEDDDKKIALMCRDIVFNSQYGVFYYEPSSKKEAELMCRKFEEHISFLRRKYDLPPIRWDITFNDIKNDKEYKCDWVWCMFPNGKTGYRLEYIDDSLYNQEFGTLIVDDGKLRIIQW